MSAEQVVRSFLSAFETGGVDPALVYLADDMTMRGVNPPLSGDKTEFARVGALIKEAMPDYKWGVQSVTTQGDRVQVDMLWTGSHRGTLHLSAFVPGAPDIPPTGKKVSVPDRFIFTVRGDKISAVLIDSGANGGIPEMLKQIGVQLPHVLIVP